MDYYVFKNNEQVGPFALMDVRDRLKSGVFAYEDLAWREGMPEWTPLKEILGGALPDATPHSVSGSSSTRAAPSGKAPALLRLLTAMVIFVVAFAVIAGAAWLVASLVCAIAVAAQSAQHAQGSVDYVALGRNACASYFWVNAVVAAVFALVLSPVIAWMTAYSNWLPWCRAR